MKKLTEKELQEYGASENIFVVKIVDGHIRLVADLEYWENAADENALNFIEDDYRIEEFHSSFANNDWILNNDIVDKGDFLEAAVDIRGDMCGGIYFYHEDKNSRKQYSSALEELLVMHNEYLTILQITEKEIADLYKYLKNGCYVFQIIK